MLTDLQYVVGGQTTMQALKKAIKQDLRTKEVSPVIVRRAFYDTFDWRLYNAGMLLEVEKHKDTHLFTLWDRDKARVRVMLKLSYIPVFANDFPKSPFRDLLQPIIGVRALLPVADLASTLHTLKVVNKNEKTVVRLVLEENAVFDAVAERSHRLGDRVSVLPLKGYKKDLAKVRDYISTYEDTNITKEDLLTAALAPLDRYPGDYSIEPSYTFETEEPNGSAIKKMLGSQLRLMRINEDGIKKNIDSGFLHDYRIALRRTRVLLNYSHKVFDETVITSIKKELKWLHTITEDVCDLDEFILELERYKESLTPTQTDLLDDFIDYLYIQHTKAHNNLVAELTGTRYDLFATQYGKFLQSLDTGVEQTKSPENCIAQFVTTEILELYRTVTKTGRRISNDTPLADVKKIRKQCRDLRHLLELSAVLYDEKIIRKISNSVNALHNCLDNFRVVQTQVHAIQNYLDSLDDNARARLDGYNPFFILMNVLERTQHIHRQDYALRFAKLTNANQQKYFELLGEIV